MLLPLFVNEVTLSIVNVDSFVRARISTIYSARTIHTYWRFVGGNKSLSAAT